MIGSDPSPEAKRWLFSLYQRQRCAQDHGNLWGESGEKPSGQGGLVDGRYMYPASFVIMVERQQTWNLPDPFDPPPVKQGIVVYYPELNVPPLITP
ncbi:MAG: hypothetical protein KJO21_05435 [Verrucomicrobiae bacterium]|nr:hypothetical protein [Verrucomicrobiae bacterium]NNJ43164.1 hypothetical protein [Akkermansiaceae bacterium]